MATKINEVGNVYGSLTVECEFKSARDGAHWVCVCVCGNRISVRGAALRFGAVQSCGIATCASRFIDEVGKVYGWLTVQALDHIDSKGYSFWRCLCTCDNQVTVRGRALRTGGTRSCGCVRKGETHCRFKGRGMSSMKRAFYAMKQSARNRNLSWKITDEELLQISQMTCHYCGEPPSNCSRSRHGTGDFVYNGLDRKINTEGYVADNVVACCWLCNRAKFKMTPEEFIAFCTRVAEYSVNR